MQKPVSPAQQSDMAPTLEKAIGRKVRELRQGLGVTISDLARSTELSVGMVSKIENGQTSPSLSTLKALASALNVPISMLFQEFDVRRDASFVPAGQGVKIDRRGTKSGHLYELLGHSLRSNVQVEPFLITLDEGAETHVTFQHPGYEFIYMLSGEVTYRHGDQNYDMKPGDALYFDALAPHGPERMDALPATYLSIIITPPED
ncbi:MAG: XRE family transcriptional regulator [Pseudomonadota bacterium]